MEAQARRIPSGPAILLAARGNIGDGQAQVAEKIIGLQLQRFVVFREKV